jgi:hypothetical protein
MSNRTLSHIDIKVADENLKDLAKGIISPITIILDPQDGEHSGAQWLAFQSFPDELPKDCLGAGMCEKFWQDHDDLKLPIGKGNTPNEALADLKVKAKRYYESW